jgi:predicted RNase H-like HicB family nuclease
MIIVYPALFTRTKECFLIEIPDLQIYSQSPGEDFANAIHMARDAIGLRCIRLEDDEDKIPEPSLSLNTFKGEFSPLGETVLSFVDVDLIEYRRKLVGTSIAMKELKQNLSNILSSIVEFDRIIHVECKKGNVVILAYFGDIRTLISETSGQPIGIIRTAYRIHPDTLPG